MVALTHPYLTTSVVVAVPEGADVSLRTSPAWRSRSRRERSKPASSRRRTPSPSPSTDVVAAVEEGSGSVTSDAFAIENWLIDDLDLEDTDVTLIETDHVMAMPMGENAWLVRLERYLLTHETEIISILDEEGTP